MHALANDIKTYILDLLFPVSCVLCNNGQEVLCMSCMSRIRKVPQQVCFVCQRPSLEGITHPRCSSPQAPDGILSLFDYQDEEVAHSIIVGKYYFIPNVFGSLGAFLANWIVQNNGLERFKNFIITPLPLAPMRIRWRGFNQANLIATELAGALKILNAEILIRTRNTKTQKNLSKEARRKNTEGAFSLKEKNAPPWYARFVTCKTITPVPTVYNKDIILVDDVITTGSTLKEAVKILKRSGAKTVWCITIARD